MDNLLQINPIAIEQMQVPLATPVSAGTASLLTPATGTMFDPISQYAVGVQQKRAEHNKQMMQRMMQERAVRKEQERYDYNKTLNSAAIAREQAVADKKLSINDKKAKALAVASLKIRSAIAKKAGVDISGYSAEDIVNASKEDFKRLIGESSSAPKGIRQYYNQQTGRYELRDNSGELISVLPENVGPPVKETRELKKPLKSPDTFQVGFVKDQLQRILRMNNINEIPPRLVGMASQLAQASKDIQTKALSLPTPVQLSQEQAFRMALKNTGIQFQKGDEDAFFESDQQGSVIFPTAGSK